MAVVVGVDKKDQTQAVLLALVEELLDKVAETVVPVEQLQAAQAVLEVVVPEDILVTAVLAATLLLQALLELAVAVVVAVVDLVLLTLQDLAAVLEYLDLVLTALVVQRPSVMLPAKTVALVLMV